MTLRTRRGRERRRREAGNGLAALAGVCRGPALVLTDTRSSCQVLRRDWLNLAENILIDNGAGAWLSPGEEVMEGVV